MLEAVALAANAGVDMELPIDSTPQYLQLYDAVVKGMVSYDTILQRVSKVFYMRMRLGMFDPPELNPYANINMSVVQSESHRKLAEIAATKTFVLLKNDGILPLPDGKISKLAVRWILRFMIIFQ